MNEKDVIHEMYPLENVDPGQELVTSPPNFKVALHVILERRCREHIPSMEAEVKVLINENHQRLRRRYFYKWISCLRCAWTFTVNSYGRIVKGKARSAFAATACSITMVTTAVTKALSCLKSQDYTQAGILSDLTNILKNIQAGSLRQQLFESLRMSRIHGLKFTFVPCHAGVRRNERADQLADSTAMEEW